MELNIRSIYKKLAGAALVVIALGVVLLLLDSGGAGGLIREIRLGPVSFEYVSPWHETNAGEIATHGLRFYRPLGLKAPGRELVAGALQNGTPTPGGLPAPALASFKSERADRSQLRNAEAAVYSGPKKHGDELLTIYIVPTARGDIGIACTETPETGSGGCLGIAETLRVLGPEAIPVGPDRELDSSLTKVLEPVVLAHDRHESVGGSAESIRAITDHLADLDLAAGKALDGMNVEARSQRSVSTLSASLAAESRHLRRVAKYVRRAHGSKYGEAVKALDLDHQSILGAIHHLYDEGLTVPAVGSIEVASKSGGTSAGVGHPQSTRTPQGESSPAAAGTTEPESETVTPVQGGGSSGSGNAPPPEPSPSQKGAEINGHVEHAESLNSGGLP